MRTRVLINQFLSSRRARRRSPRTITWYRGFLEPFVRVNPELPQDPGTVEAFLGMLTVSDETHHAYYRALRAFYRWLHRRYREVPDVMEDIDPPSRSRKKPWSLTIAELGYLFAVPLSKRDRTLISLLVDTGARISEALGLDTDGINHDTIVVSGKTGQREVPISPETREQLLALGGPPIFQGTKGPLTYSGAYRIVQLALKAAGISARKWGPHVLRHSFGRQYIMAGGDLVSLQRIMGHSDIKTTRIYAELDLRDITAQHRRFTPLKQALAGSQMEIWRGQGSESSRTPGFGSQDSN